MSLHINALLIRGCPLAAVDEILGRFGYVLAEERDVWSGLGELPAGWQLAATDAGGWLAILESEFSLHDDLDACKDVAMQHETSVFGITCEGFSRTYAFSYADPLRTRTFERVGREIRVDRGDPLEEEVTAPATEEDILKLLARVAVPYQVLEEAKSFVRLSVADDSGARRRFDARRYSPDGIRTLVQRMFDRDNGYALRLVAIRQLVSARASEQSGEIAKLLQDEDPRLRGEALWALDKLDARDRAAGIEMLLRDRKRFDRIAGPLSDSPLKFETVVIADYAREVLSRWGFEMKPPGLWSKIRPF